MPTSTRRIGLSVVVIELLLGVAIGPQCLRWATPTMGALPAFATLGLAFLFFIAGLEIDLPAIRGTPEFIKREHAEYLARYIPGARFELLAGVSHFAPLQRSAQFNASIVSFLDALPR